MPTSAFDSIFLDKLVVKINKSDARFSLKLDSEDERYLKRDIFNVSRFHSTRNTHMRKFCNTTRFDFAIHAGFGDTPELNFFSSNLDDELNAVAAKYCNSFLVEKSGAYFAAFF
jgi:hypothetical protein